MALRVVVTRRRSLDPRTREVSAETPSDGHLVPIVMQNANVRLSVLVVSCMMGLFCRVAVQAKRRVPVPGLGGSSRAVALLSGPDETGYMKAFVISETDQDC